MAKSLGAICLQTAKHPTAVLDDPRHFAISVCCFMFQINFPFTSAPRQGVWIHTPLPCGEQRGPPRQLVRDKPFCRLRAYFRRCSVHLWLCSAPGARGRRKAAPAQLQPGKQKCPASSRSLHTEMPICFQNQILHGSIE